MSQPLVATSLAVLVDKFMNNIADLKIQADLIEGNFAPDPNLTPINFKN